MAQNNILLFSEDLRGCMCIGVPLCTPLMQLLEKDSSIVHFDYTLWFILITTNNRMSHIQRGSLVCVSTPSGPPQKNVKCHINKLTVVATVTNIMTKNDMFSEEDLRGFTCIKPSLSVCHPCDC